MTFETVRLPFYHSLVVTIRRHEQLQHFVHQQKLSLQLFLSFSNKMIRCFFVVHDSKLKIFGFSTVGHIKPFDDTNFDSFLTNF